MPRLVLAVLLALALSACAQQAAGPAGATPPVLSSPDPADPYEQTNRAMLNGMLALDDAVVLPVAKTYRTVVPGWVRTRLRNVLQNMQEPGVAVNRLLQGRPLLAGQSVMRFVVNSTLGLGAPSTCSRSAARPSRSSISGRPWRSGASGTGLI